MKALQSSRLLEVACQPRFPSLKTMLLTKSPSLDWGNTAMSSSLQDSTPSRAGCRPRWSWKPTYTFLGLAPTSKSNCWRARKGTSPASSRKLCVVGAAYSPDNALNTKVCSSAPFSHAESQAAPRKARTSHMQGNLHVWFWPGTPVYCTNMCRSP